jgi:hypothetical protein
MFKMILVCAGVAQLGEQQTEAYISVLEVPCSIHGPGIFFPIFHFDVFFIPVMCKDPVNTDQIFHVSYATVCITSAHMLNVAED